MQRDCLEKYEESCKGWVVGNFTNSLRNTNFEVGIKNYAAGDTNPRHWHDLAEEINIVLAGSAEFVFDDKVETVIVGDIIVIEKGEPSSFRAITPIQMVVIKTTSYANDKHT